MLKILDESRGKKDELEKGYYGISSTEVFVEMHTYISDHIKTCLSFISDCLTENGYEKQQIIIIIKDLYNKNMNSLQPLLEKFQDELQKIFEVPHDIMEKRVFSDDEISKLQRELHTLRLEYFREKIFLEKLKQKHILVMSLKPLIEDDKIRLESIKNLKMAIKQKREIEGLKTKYNARFQKFSKEFMDSNEHFRKDEDCLNTLLQECRNNNSL